MRIPPLLCSLSLSAYLCTYANGGPGRDSVSTTVPALGSVVRRGAQALTPSREALNEFFNEGVVFDRDVFPPGKFPSVRWSQPDWVTRNFGNVSLTVEYLDHSYARVERAASPGRYGAIVRGTLPGGFRIVRYVTIYCCEQRFDDYGPDVPLVMHNLPNFDITSGKWDLYRKNLRRFSFGSLLLFPEYDPDAAVFLAGLADLPPRPSPQMTPRVVDRQWWIGYKRLNDGVCHPNLDFSLQVVKHRGPILDERLSPGTFSATDLKLLRSLCTSWSDSTGVPLTALIVRKGRVVFHESFGGKPSLLTTAAPTWMASITKALTGTLVMQFAERGYLDLDAPLDRYLPELGPQCPLTLRLLLTHTSDLSWTGDWASDWNPSMENEVAQALPLLEPGKEFVYTRAGYALTAKVLERISGEPLPLLFERMILSPLGMTRSTVDNSYGGLFAPALDVARFALMLLQRGLYGSHRLLSEKVWAEMLPAPLHMTNSLSHSVWGIGLSPFNSDGLSDSTFGHGAASGAIFRIDPERELVIVVGRDSPGPDERLDRRCSSRFIRAVATAIEGRGKHE